MEYQEFIDLIYARYSGNVKLGLERMQGLLEDLGNPQDRLRGFHVAGTNGKGSVCATLEALCLAHGFRTGLNTSPHLVNYNERIRIMGQELPIDEIIATFTEHSNLFDKWDASFFEITTAIAFILFARREIDVAVIEVGLGGRLDATNPFKPDVSLITTIALDHIKTLGGDIKVIAGEKAGIIKKGIPLILGEIEPEPRAVIEAKAITLKSPTFIHGEDWKVSFEKSSAPNASFDYKYKDVCYKGLRSNLIGDHQVTNVGQALTAFIIFCQNNKLKYSEDKIRQALMNINWKGRIQLLEENPTVIIDGAHNVHGLKALMKTLDRLYPERKLIFVISILADKNYPEMLRMICQKAEKVFVAQNTSQRAATVKEQIVEVRKNNVEAIACDSVADALRFAKEAAGKDGVIVAGGSLFTVGELISASQNNA
ncbi:MAG: bifunctional folylpolyglutamate synthase/dihydrofolate synthase [Candidatus Cloacimonetes bacterium]|jgi:dihydrofolate synthase/folylpolyglutamate synthase|nr:bifunctional folylpolyglutamate synthase/dihydrofolate synthase [Candidatus Cloacimonadota bacterium]